MFISNRSSETNHLILTLTENVTLTPTPNPHPSLTFRAAVYLSQLLVSLNVMNIICNNNTN